MAYQPFAMDPCFRDSNLTNYIVLTFINIFISYYI